MSMVSLPDPGLRQWFIFAMKDPLPLGPEGWGVTVHQPECGRRGGELGCLAGEFPCYADQVQFFAFPDDNDELSRAMERMSKVVGKLARKQIEEQPPPPDLEPMGDLLWAVAASTMVREHDEPGDVYGRVSDLVIDSVAALRNATGAGIPDPTIERMHPFYLTGHEDPIGNFEATGIVVVEHVWFGPPPPASVDQLDIAAQFLISRWVSNPIETYRNFATQARNAIRFDGDYTKAVLLAAIASEILIKHAAWMLTMEAERMDQDPVPTADTERLGGRRPSQLIGGVLQPRLGGNWNSHDSSHPVGAWRQHIARKRAEVLHRGGKVSGAEADEAIIAMRELETHIVDRLAESGKTYPRTAFAQVGLEGLKKRGKFEEVTERLSQVAGSPEDWIEEYVRYLDRLMDDASS